MATPFPLPVTAAQVGTYFVGQYYQVLQRQPEFVHQFYSDASTVVRIDGNTRETATAMLQIHSLIMSFSFTGIEIKAAQSLESWSGGVLVMVSGSVQIKNFNGRRKFGQTFFLAPQEKGYFVLNDIFHFIDEEPIQHRAPIFLPQIHLDPRLNAPATIPETVSNYFIDEDALAREFIAPVGTKENGVVNGFSFPDQQLHQSPVPENIMDNNNSVEEANGSPENTVNSLQDHQPAPVEEPVEEPQKHTYASILQVPKGQSVLVVASQPPVNKSSPPASEWNLVSEPTSHEPIVSSNVFDSSGETVEEASAIEDDGEIKSVYVKNVGSAVTESEIEEEFKKFGKIRPDGVAIRSRKDVGVCYAFVEFEDMTGVQNAIKAGSAEVGGRQVFIEGRRPNNSLPFRGGRGRGRGRGNYYYGDATRGRFFGGRGFGRVNGHDGGDYGNRPRGNGVYRPVFRHDRGGFSSNQVSRGGQKSSE